MSCSWYKPSPSSILHMAMVTPVAAVQRTRPGTTNAVEILLMGKQCKFNVSFILTEILRISFCGVYGITRGWVFVVLSKF